MVKCYLWNKTKCSCGKMLKAGSYYFRDGDRMYCNSCRPGIKIKLSDGRVIKRVPKVVPFGNFQQMIVTVDKKRYLVGDGDEYLRGGLDQVFTLGKELS